MKNQTLVLTSAVCFVVVMTLQLGAQVPIDLSQAREFRVVWKLELGSELFPIHYVPSLCGNEGFDVLVGSTIKSRFTWRTRPTIDTTSFDRSLGILPHAIDYDGVPPLEYVNSRGHVLQCAQDGPDPLPMNIIDTVAGCSEVPEFSADIDGDGFLDVATDVGGGGYTARVIRGGPNAGRKCERILYVPYAPVEEGTNVNTCLFWRSSSAGFRLMQTEVKENRSWVVIYDVGFRREGNTITTTFTPIDSLTGKGFGGPSHCALVTDTLLEKDWLLMFRFDAGINQNVLERFDATEGVFDPTGERITGADFYQPWNMGYALGTVRPVIMLGEGSLCYADELSRPFARIRFKDSGVQPVSGWAAINDQSGDGKPDLVIAGGSTNGTVIMLTLDSTASSVADNNNPLPQISARMLGTTLEVVTTQPVMISAQLVTTDGRMFPTLPPTQGSVGLNRFDLTSAVEALPKGVYYLKVLIGEGQRTVSIVR